VVRRINERENISGKCGRKKEKGKGGKYC